MNSQKDTWTESEIEFGIVCSLILFLLAIFWLVLTGLVFYFIVHSRVYPCRIFSCPTCQKKEYTEDELKNLIEEETIFRQSQMVTNV